MKPNFALDLSPDGVRLFHRSATGWRDLGAALFTESAFAERLGWLRATALELEPEGIATKLILPPSEVLYTEIVAPGPDASSRRRQIRAALADMTPYPVEDLAFDWVGDGPVVQVAVVARETLEEAETFAADSRFVPLCFVAAPPPGRFAGEPCFAQTRVAAALLPEGVRVERDGAPVYAGVEPEEPEPPKPEVPEPQPPAPDLPEPELPPQPGEAPPDHPEELPPDGPVEAPDTPPVEIPDPQPPEDPVQPPVMTVRRPSPEAAAATLAPLAAPDRGLARRRALQLTGGLVAALVVVWLLAGLLPAKVSAWFEDGSRAADPQVASVAEAPVATLAAVIIADPPKARPAMPVREAQSAPVSPRPAPQPAPQIVAPIPAAAPALAPARPERRVVEGADGLRQALAAAEIPVFRPGASPFLALVDPAPKRAGPLKVKSIPPAKARPGTAVTASATPTTGESIPAPRPRPGSAPAPATTDLAVAEEASPTSTEPARLSPRAPLARPAAVVKRAEAENPPVALALQRPRARPRDFSTSVEAALASVAPVPAPVVVPTPAPAIVRTAPVVAAVAPVLPQPTVRAPAPVATAAIVTPRKPVEPEAEDEMDSAFVAPAIPTRANVAKQATLSDAINLRKVNLIGVYGTANNRRALVRLSNGQMQRVKVGDRLDGGQVAAIGDKEIRYIKSGRALALVLPET